MHEQATSMPTPRTRPRAGVRPSSQAGREVMFKARAGRAAPVGRDLVDTAQVAAMIGNQPQTLKGWLWAVRWGGRVAPESRALMTLSFLVGRRRWWKRADVIGWLRGQQEASRPQARAGAAAGRVHDLLARAEALEADCRVSGDPRMVRFARAMAALRELTQGTEGSES